MHWNKNLSYSSTMYELFNGPREIINRETSAVIAQFDITGMVYQYFTAEFDFVFIIFLDISSYCFFSLCFQIMIVQCLLVFTRLVLIANTYMIFTLLYNYKTNDRQQLTYQFWTN